MIQHTDDDANEEEAMLPRGPLIKERFPADNQIVEVRVGNGDWQPATYSNGEFVDSYGITLDRRKVTGWRPVNSNAVNNGG